MLAKDLPESSVVADFANEGTAAGGEVRAKGPCVCLAQAIGLGGGGEGNRRANGPAVCARFCTAKSWAANIRSANGRTLGPNLFW